MMMETDKNVHENLSSHRNRRTHFISYHMDLANGIIFRLLLADPYLQFGEGSSPSPASNI